jgi:hypothetical protein
LHINTFSLLVFSVSHSDGVLWYLCSGGGGGGGFNYSPHWALLAACFLFVLEKLVSRTCVEEENFFSWSENSLLCSLLDWGAHFFTFCIFR